MRIFILTGQMGHGKDTCASIIRRRVDNTKSVAFADAIKQISGILFGWNKEHFNGWLKEREDERFGITPRTFYQRFGDWGRNTLPVWFPKYDMKHGNNLWVNIAIDKIKTFNEDDTVLITDARYPNEVNAIKRAFGPDSVSVVKVVRPSIELPWYKRIFLHSSERMLKGIKADWIVVNSTLDNLEQSVGTILTKEGVI